MTAQTENGNDARDGADRPGPAARTFEERARSRDPGPHRDVLVRVLACGVCRTDLHVQDNELPDIEFPRIPGHQAVGEVVAAGGAKPNSSHRAPGSASRGWPAPVDECEFCHSEARKSLCDKALLPRLSRRRRLRRLPRRRQPGSASRSTTGCRRPQQTPLLCGGLIGYRTLRLAGDARRTSASTVSVRPHTSITQVALHERRRVFAFTSPGDEAAQDFARRIGAEWAGGSDEPAPETARCGADLRAGRRAGAEGARRI